MPALDPALARIQNDLFDVEADLCLSEKGPGGARLTVTDAQVAWIEGEIDRLNADLAPLRSFMLPGGTPAAAYLHLARTICRRAERIMVELRDQPGESVTDASLKYVNRLSDFLFVAEPLRQRQRRARRALGAGAEPLESHVMASSIVACCSRLSFASRAGAIRSSDRQPSGGNSACFTPRLRRSPSAKDPRQQATSMTVWLPAAMR